MLVLMLIVIQRHPQRWHWHKAKNDSGTTNVCLDSRSGVVAIALSVGVRFRSGSQSGLAGVAGLSVAILRTFTLHVVGTQNLARHWRLEAG